MIRRSIFPDRGFSCASLLWVLGAFLTPSFAQSGPGQLRDITGIEELAPLPPPSPWPRRLALMASGSACLFFAGWVWIRWRRRRVPAPTPEQWALQELTLIETLSLPENGESERFHTLVSDTVRGYFERRFNLRAPRQTTPEFLEALRPAPQLSEPLQELLRDFLHRCDLAKFAQTVSSAEECRTVLAMARELVERTGGLSKLSATELNQGERGSLSPEHDP